MPGSRQFSKTHSRNKVHCGRGRDGLPPALKRNSLWKGNQVARRQEQGDASPDTLCVFLHAESGKHTTCSGNKSHYSLPEHLLPSPLLPASMAPQNQPALCRGEH